MFIFYIDKSTAATAVISQQTKMRSRSPNPLLLCLILRGSFAMDGCKYPLAWRCGDLCIGNENSKSYSDHCNCGGTIFNREAKMWCCQESPCQGKGRYIEEPDAWFGEQDEEGRIINAVCNGVALNMTQACNQTCNFYEQDPYRNINGVLRSFTACNVTHVKTTQCIPEHKKHDGRLHCKNRWDEEPFETSFENSQSLLVDPEQILTSCNINNIYDRKQGFDCTGGPGLALHGTLETSCLDYGMWCNAEYTFICTELEGKTPTGKTFDPILCANQSFWEGRVCDEDNEDEEWRCTGENPGQCWRLGSNKCTDGSSEIKLADEEEGCQDDLKCTARDGRWAGMKICLTEKFLCDNHIQCQDGVDEEGCEQQYLKKGIFRRDERYICKVPFLVISSEDNKKGKFFPKRAVRCAY